MSYQPQPETAAILARAFEYVTNTPYQVTARWVFYRLLQDGYLHIKSDYKRLLSYLSKARKQFYQDWRPDTLADDTRSPLLMEHQGLYSLFVRGESFLNGRAWLQELRSGLNCPLDKWVGQDTYIEVWFEAAAMMSQFRYYANENIPLLAFHGDVSIPAKWEAAERIFHRWAGQEKKVMILYYGDLDPKGLEIPESAERDVCLFVGSLIDREQESGFSRPYDDFLDEFTFHRVGLNPDHPTEFAIPENPERPGTYQWEALGDEGAQRLIEEANQYIDQTVIDEVKAKEERIIKQVRDALDEVEIKEDEDDG